MTLSIEKNFSLGCSLNKIFDFQSKDKKFFTLKHTPLYPTNSKLLSNLWKDGLTLSS